jgi:hypothetical protein
MTKRLTAGQKTARATIRAAVAKMLKELDEWRGAAYVEFQTDFHLACIRYDTATYQDRPIGCNWPIYVHTDSRR